MLEKVDATFLDQTAQEGDKVPTLAHFQKIFSTLAKLHAHCWGKEKQPVRAPAAGIRLAPHKESHFLNNDTLREYTYSSDSTWHTISFEPALSRTHHQKSTSPNTVKTFFTVRENQI